MAQKTFTSTTLTSADVNLYLAGEGGAWSSWTPTVTQSFGVTVTNTRSRFARYGRTIHFSLDVEVTGTGTGSNAVVISLPVTAAAGSGIIGYGALFDASATADFRAIATLASTTTMHLMPAMSAVATVLGLVEFTAGLAASDLIRVSGTYEAAS
jgi:hypothetical protein